MKTCALTAYLSQINNLNLTSTQISLIPLIDEGIRISTVITYATKHIYQAEFNSVKHTGLHRNWLLNFKFWIKSSDYHKRIDRDVMITFGRS
jgi:hypothetical protein